jgi:hypothetical protein
MAEESVSLLLPGRSGEGCGAPRLRIFATRTDVRSTTAANPGQKEAPLRPLD